ncbi:MAG: hypothetical protein AAF921_28510, partial [Cyanobacteria bacterium P01_D01_bin.44]
ILNIAVLLHNTAQLNMLRFSPCLQSIQLCRLSNASIVGDLLPELRGSYLNNVPSSRLSVVGTRDLKLLKSGTLLTGMSSKARKGEFRLLLLAVEADTLLDQSIALLNSIHLDFSLRTYGLMTDVQTINLLGGHSETIHFQVPQNDFFQAWQYISKVYDQLEEMPTTGLIIAPLEIIQLLLKNA